MSLHTLASHLQHAGRGDDKVLVHMTPNEVDSLQSLAKSHGGSLTINPQTGLPEAGFLSSILPMIAGAGLMMIPGMQPLAAAALVGGGTAVATGSLQKGLMAGLGAYGGAGLGQGLMAAAPTAAPVGAVTGPMADIGAVNITAPTAFPSAFGSAQTAAQTAAQTGGLSGLGGLNAKSIMFKPEILAQNMAPGAVLDANLAAYNTAKPVTQGITGAPSGSAMSIADKYPQQIPSNLGFKAPQTYMPSGVNVESIPTRFDQLPTGMSADLRAQEAVMQTTGIGGIGGGRGIRPDVSGYNPSIPNVNVANISSKVTPAQMAKYTPSELSNFEKMKAGFGDVTSSGKNAWEFVKDNPMPFISSGLAIAEGMKPEYVEPKKQKSLIRPYDYSYNATSADLEPYSGSGERTYFNPTYTARTPYEAPGPEYAANGGLMGIKYAVGGPVEQMSAQNAVGANQMYPQSQLQSAMYSNPMVQRPQANNVVNPSGDAGVYPYTGEARFATGGSVRPSPLNAKMASVDSAAELMKTQQGLQQTIKAAKAGDYAAMLALKNAGYDMNKLNEYAGGGGVSSLGGYSDGGRLLRGPGDGVSDSIPASIGNRQPARLADGEFVVPARIVSELGNGSTEAGAKQLYSMMDRVQKARGKTTGKGRVAVNSKASKHLPA